MVSQSNLAPSTCDLIHMLPNLNFSLALYIFCIIGNMPWAITKEFYENQIMVPLKTLAWPIWKVSGELRQLMLHFISLACSFTLDFKKQLSKNILAFWEQISLIAGFGFFSWSKSIGGTKSRTWKESGRIREKTGSRN